MWTVTCTWTKVSTCGRAPVGIKNMTPADFRIKAVRQPMVVFGGQMVQVGCVLGGAQRMKLKCLDLGEQTYHPQACVCDTGKGCSLRHACRSRIAPRVVRVGQPLLPGQRK